MLYHTQSGNWVNGLQPKALGPQGRRGHGSGPLRLQLRLSVAWLRPTKQPFGAVGEVVR